MIIYTDGSCSANGSANNNGGFGVVVLNNNEKPIYFYSKKSKNTTNNREEIKSILYSLLRFGYLQEEVIVYSDSNYCVQTFNNWMYNWAKNGWIKSDKKVPENLDLIKEYYNYVQKGYRIDLRKIKGHSDNKWNNIADKLATGKLSIIDAYKNEGLTCPLDQFSIYNYFQKQE